MICGLELPTPTSSCKLILAYSLIAKILKDPRRCEWESDFKHRNLPSHSLISVSAKLQEAVTQLCVFERSSEQPFISSTSGKEILPACPDLLVWLEIFEQQFMTFSARPVVSRAVPEAAPAADEPQQPAVFPSSSFPSRCTRMLGLWHQNVKTFRLEQ